MEHFLIVTNDGKDPEGKVTGIVIDTLKERGMRYTLGRKDADKNIITESLPKDIDCAIVLGGDGSFIEVARILKSEIPILGINLGTVGYLAEVEPENARQALNRILDGDYMIENRMMLDGQFNDGSGNVALNDIVLSRKGPLRMLHFNLYVNGELLNAYSADGIIISTPTGSTAYNLSAGGPIVEPTAQMMVVTPICSHALNTSSIVLSAEDEITIEIGATRHNKAEEVYISFDGTSSRVLSTGDTITIRRSRMSTQLMKLSNISFLEILRRKMRG